MVKPLCVVIHGFTGNPTEVQSVTEALQTLGYDVAAPLLPGHSFALEQLEKATAEEWIDSVDTIVSDAFNKGREVHLIGFSMGAMIAAILAHRYTPLSLTLLSPAIYVVTPHLVMTRTKGALQLLLKEPKKVPQTIRDNWDVSRFTPVHNLRQFRRLVRQARDIIPHLTLPVCIIYGTQDPIVDPRSSHWIAQTVASKQKSIFQLPLSGHFICQESEQGQVIDIVTDFLRNQQHSPSPSTPH